MKSRIHTYRPDPVIYFARPTALDCRSVGLRSPRQNRCQIAAARLATYLGSALFVAGVITLIIHHLH